MDWIHYRLKFRLCSPLHVGHRKVGNLMQTRPYVPGKVLWAALTARLTRDKGNGHQGDAYISTGELLQKNFRFGYLWPSLENEKPYYPWDNPADFDYQLLGSYMSTAISGRGSSEEGYLHEVEYLAPRTRDGQQVYLVGDLWVLKSFPVDCWISSLEKVQLGAERHYGWGRVNLEPLDQHDDQKSPIGFRIGEDERIPAHVKASGAEMFLSGSVEPLLGWETKSDGRLSLSAKATIAFAPGACLKDGMEPGDVSFTIRDNGIWEVSN